MMVYVTQPQQQMVYATVATPTMVEQVPVYSQQGPEMVYAAEDPGMAPGAPMAVSYAQHQPVVLANGAPEMQMVYQQQQVVPEMTGMQLVQQEPGMQLVQQEPGMQLVQQEPGMQLVQQVIEPVQQQLMPVKHVPLAKCRCLYLGCAVPLETTVGLEAIQQPLRERFRTDMKEMQGIDAWLTVYSSGLQLKFVEESDAVHWFPISALHVCAAVKAIDLVMETGHRHTKFVALDSDHGKKSLHPPIFAAILRRTKGRKVLECHAFICKSNEAAMALVQSCTHAFEHKEGWCEEEPPADLAESHNPMRLLAADPLIERDAPNEYYKPPPKSGYFYTTKKDLVKNYAVNGNTKQPPIMQPAIEPGMYPMMQQPNPDPELYQLNTDPELYQQAMLQEQQMQEQQMQQQQMQQQQMQQQQMQEQQMQEQQMQQQQMQQQMQQQQMMQQQQQQLPAHAAYFQDWNAFPGYPVAIFNQPEAYGYPGVVEGKPKKRKKKKKSKKSKNCNHCVEDTCCCQTDDSCDDICNRNEYFVDNYYKNYNKHRSELCKKDSRSRKDHGFFPPQRDDRRRDDRRRDDLRRDDLRRDDLRRDDLRRDDLRRDARLRDDYHIRREDDRYGGQVGRVFLEGERCDPVCDDPYMRHYYEQPRFYDSPRAPIFEDDFQFFAPGYAYAPGYDGYDPFSYGYDDYGDQFYDPYCHCQCDPLSECHQYHGHSVQCGHSGQCGQRGQYRQSGQCGQYGQRGQCGQSGQCGQRGQSGQFGMGQLADAFHNNARIY